MNGARVAALASVLVSACSLFVSLDGLDSDPDGGRRDATAGSDAHVSHASDAGSDHAASGTDAGSGTGAGTGGGAGNDSGNSYAAAVLADTPLAYWPLDETTGTTAHDATAGDKHPGTLNGGVTVGAPGAVRNAMTFDGTGCIGITNGNDFQFVAPAPFSIEFWVNPSAETDFQFMVSTEIHPGTRHGWSVVLDPQPTPYADIEGWNADATAVNGGFIFGAYTGHPGVAGGQGIAPSTWTHIVGTYDGSTLAQIYVNGALISPGPGAPPLPAQGSLALGCSTFGAPYGAITGALDEVAVYSGVLSAGRIFAHYQAR